MTRQEFSQIISEYRKNNKQMIKDICFKLSCLPKDIYRIEKAIYSYNLQKCLEYLNAIELNMIIHTPDNKHIVINCYDDLVSTLILCRKQVYTQQSLAEKANCSRISITYFESKKTIITIDSLLKLCEALGVSISVEPIEINNN